MVPVTFLAPWCALLAVLALVAGSRPPTTRRPAPLGGSDHRQPGRGPAVVERLLSDVGSTRSPGEVWRATALGATVAGIGGGMLVGPAVTLLVGATLLVTPLVLAPVLRRRRVRRRDALLPDWLEQLASALRAGASPSGAVSATAASAPWPLREDLERLDRSVRHGAGLGEGLQAWRSGVDATPAVVLVASALDLGLRSGGELARSVDRMAATLRDRAEAQAEVRALATQARASATLLALAPLGFALLLATIEPAMVRFLVTTPIGWACLVGGLALEGLGAAWMARIMASAA
jgi:tight adherence protein B